MKQHIRHAARQVDACPKVPKQVIEFFFLKHLNQRKNTSVVKQSKKETLLQSINFLDENKDDDVFDIDEQEMEA